MTDMTDKKVDVSFISSDRQVAEFLQHLKDWHAGEVRELQELLVLNTEALKGGLLPVQDGEAGEVIPLSESHIMGLKLGLHIALQRLGELPFNVTDVSDADGEKLH